MNHRTTLFCHLLLRTLAVLAVALSAAATPGTALAQGGALPESNTAPPTPQPLVGEEGSAEGEEAFEEPDANDREGGREEAEEVLREPDTSDSEVVRPVHPGETATTTEGEHEEEEEEEEDYIIPLPLRTAGALGDGYVLQPPEERPGEWDFSFGGYIRVGYRAIANDPSLPFTGRNDGFLLANARPLVVGKYGRSLGFRIQLEGAAEIGSGDRNPSRDLVARLRDAFLFYSPHPALEIQAGRFRAPFEIEALFSTADMMFPTRSVVAEGVASFEGLELSGLSVDREVGVMITASTPLFPFSSDIAKPHGPGISYAVAMTNGSSADASLNDNDQLAYYGRLALHWGDLLRVGGAAHYNDTTLGDLPDQVGEQLLGLTGDVSLAAFGFTLLGSFVRQERSVEVEAEPQRVSQGYQVQLGWQDPWIGLQPAVRWASLDPFADYLDRDEAPIVELEDRQLNYLSVGLNFNPPGLPFRSLLTYTLTLEQEARELNNDRLDVLFQVNW